MDSKEYENRSSLEHKKFAVTMIDIVSKVQVPSQFQDNTSTWQNRFWPRKKRTKLRWNPLLKQDNDKRPTVTLTPVSIPVREREWIDIETQRSQRSTHVFWSVKSHYQTVPRGSDGAIQYNVIIEEYRKKKKFDGASQWSLEDWISILAKGGGGAKKKSILLESRLFQFNSYTFEQSKDIQEKMLLILSCKTKYCYRKELPSTSTTSGTARQLNSNNQKWIDSRREKPQKRKTSCVHGNGKGEIRDLTKPRDRCTQEYLETPSKYGTLVQFEARSRRKACNFTKHGHMQSISTTHYPAACIEKAVCMKTQEGALPESSLNSKSATGCTQIELAIRSTRSTKPRRKIILGTIKRFEELLGNL